MAALPCSETEVPGALESFGKYVSRLQAEAREAKEQQCEEVERLRFEVERLQRDLYAVQLKLQQAIEQVRERDYQVSCLAQQLATSGKSLEKTLRVHEKERAVAEAAVRQLEEQLVQRAQQCRAAEERSSEAVAEAQRACKSELLIKQQLNVLNQQLEVAQCGKETALQVEAKHASSTQQHKQTEQQLQQKLVAVQGQLELERREKEAALKGKEKWKKQFGDLTERYRLMKNSYLRLRKERGGCGAVHDGTQLPGGELAGSGKLTPDPEDAAQGAESEPEQPAADKRPSGSTRVALRLQPEDMTHHPLPMHQVAGSSGARAQGQPAGIVDRLMLRNEPPAPPEGGSTTRDGEGDPEHMQQQPSQEQPSQQQPAQLQQPQPTRPPLQLREPLQPALMQQQALLATADCTMARCATTAASSPPCDPDEQCSKHGFQSQGKGEQGKGEQPAMEHLPMNPPPPRPPFGGAAVAARIAHHDLPSPAVPQQLQPPPAVGFLPSIVDETQPDTVQHLEQLARTPQMQRGLKRLPLSLELMQPLLSGPAAPAPAKQLSFDAAVAPTWGPGGGSITAAAAGSLLSGGPAWKKAARPSNSDMRCFDVSETDLVPGQPPLNSKMRLGQATRVQQHGSCAGGTKENTASTGFKYQDVVRKRDEREKLKGVECLECKRFYEALESWDTLKAAGQGLPACGHNPVPVGDSGMALTSREELRQYGSRHRYRHEPPATPQDYWNMDFTPAEDGAL